MLQHPCKTLDYKKNMALKFPRKWGGKPYLASGLHVLCLFSIRFVYVQNEAYSDFLFDSRVCQRTGFGWLKVHQT